MYLRVWQKVYPCPDSSSKHRGSESSPRFHLAPHISPLLVLWGVTTGHSHLTDCPLVGQRGAMLKPSAIKREDGRLMAPRKLCVAGNQDAVRPHVDHMKKWSEERYSFHKSGAPGDRHECSPYMLLSWHNQWTWGKGRATCRKSGWALQVQPGVHGGPAACLKMPPANRKSTQWCACHNKKCVIGEAFDYNS